MHRNKAILTLCKISKYLKGSVSVIFIAQILPLQLTFGQITFETISIAKETVGLRELTIAKPVGTVEGDVLIAVLSTDANRVLVAPDVNWAQIEHRSNSATLASWWKAAGPAEPDSYTFTWNANEKAVGAILRYTGINTLNAVDTSVTKTGYGKFPWTAELTTNIDGALILQVLGVDDDDLPVPTWLAYPTGMDGRFSEESSSGSGTVSAALADIQQSSAGLVDSTNFTLLLNEGWVTATIALAPGEEVAFALDSSRVSENSDTARIDLLLTGLTGTAVHFDYSVVGGTAGGSDYVMGSGTLVIPAGDTTATIDIAIVDDPNDEPAETIDIIIANPTGAVLGSQTTHTLSLDDDDAPPAIAFRSASINNSESVTQIDLDLDLSVASAFDVSVDYTVTGGSASGGGTDFTIADGTANIPAGGTTTSIALSIAQDALDELDETIEITLAVPVNASIGANNPLTYTIDDDDDQPVLQIAADSSSWSEAADTVRIPVTLSAVSGLTVTADYGQTGGTATSAIDYSFAGSSLSIAAGDSTGEIVIVLVDDPTEEVNESIEVAISNPANATLGSQTTHNLTIEDNEARPIVTFAADSSSGNESTANPAIAITMSGVWIVDAVIDYTVSSLDAQGGGADYSFTGTVTIPAGQTTADIIATITDDALDESDEELTITLVSVSDDVNIGSENTYEYTIIDNDPLPTASMAIAISSGDENIADATMQASLVPASGRNVVVQYAVTGTSDASDHDLIDGSITILAGQTSADLAIAINDDVIDEDAETVIVTITAADYASIGGSPAATYTIIDDDSAPVVQFATATANNFESFATVTVDVILEPVSGKTVSVDYASAGGTADTSDYNFTPGTLTINPGSNGGSFTITVVDDGSFENGETAIFNLGNETNATLGAKSAHTYTILDNDAPQSVQFTLDSLTVSEDTGTVAIAVSLSSVTGMDVVVAYAMIPVTASATEDYTTAAGTVTIPAGELSGTFDLSVVDDNMDEAIELLQLELSNPQNASLGLARRGYISIEDNDLPPTVGFRQGITNLSENGSVISVPVDLSSVSGRDITVDYSAGGSALAGEDYRLTDGTITISAGQATTSISVEVLEDGVPELDDTLIIALSNPVNASIGTVGTHSIIIVNDDADPYIQFNSSTLAAYENSSATSFSITLSAVSGRDVEVGYTVSGTAAGAGDDYTLAGTTVNIPAGQTEGALNASLHNDALFETDETIIVTLIAPVGATIGAQNTTTFTILNDDSAPTLQFAAGDTLVNENAGTIPLVIDLSNISGLDAEVEYSISGTAETAEDYNLAGSVLSLPAGSSSATLNLAIVDDLVNEASESLTITLSNPVGAVFGFRTEKTIIIADNDGPPTVSFTTSSSSGSEALSPAAPGLVLSAPSQFSITVDVQAVGIEAAAGQDFYLASSQVSFTSGVTSLDINVVVFNDLVDEIDEAFQVVLSNPANAELGAITTHSYTIEDDDESPATITVGNPVTTGGTVVTGVWNSTNTSIDVPIPVDDSPALVGGQIQLIALTGDEIEEDVGIPHAIAADDLGSTSVITLDAATVETHPAFIEGDTMTFTAVITDRAGNTTEAEPSTSRLLIDETAPAAYLVGAIRALGGTEVEGYWNSTNTSLNIEIPVENDPTLINGTVQLEAKVNGTFEAFGLVESITATAQIAQLLAIEIPATVADGTGVEELQGLTDGDLIQIRASVFDGSGNGTTFGVSTSIIIVDQTQPGASIGYSQQLARADDEITITSTFTESVTGVTLGMNYQTLAVPPTPMDATENLTWQEVITIPADNTGLVSVDLAAIDLAGNPLDTNSVTGRDILIIDNLAPGYSVTYSDSIVKGNEVVLVEARFTEGVETSPRLTIDLPGTAADINDVPMLRLSSDSVWTHYLTMPATGDGAATVTISATDQVGNTAVASGIDALILDNTPPVLTIDLISANGYITTDDVDYSVSENLAEGSITWSVAPSSAVPDGAAPYNILLADSLLAQGTHLAALGAGLSLTEGTTYTIMASITDYAGHEVSSELGYNVILDSHAPNISSAFVYDGTGEDLEYKTSTSSYEGNWGGFSDPVSGIANYDYSLGSAFGDTDITAWQNTGLATNIGVTALELVFGSTVYLNIRATDNAGNISSTVSSNGIAILAKPALSLSLAQNSVYFGGIQLFLVDSLGMAQTVSLNIDGGSVQLTEVDEFTYMGSHNFTSAGLHSIEVTGSSLVGDTVLTPDVPVTLAKTNGAWSAVSLDKNFIILGDPGAVTIPQYLTVIDSTLLPSSLSRAGTYRIGDGASRFSRPVKVIMQPDKAAKELAVYRLVDGSSWEEIPSIDEAGQVIAWTTVSGTYRLGERTIIVPHRTSLQQNYPNPFNPSTTISFDLGFADGPEQQVKVMIYDLRGRELATLYDGELALGHHSLQWRGIDRTGRQVASGIYFVRLVAGSNRQMIRKMVLVR
ncbi:Calx-beta domain-containing protein [Candidatus Neomarinimicrobiota bacterium]